MALYEPIVVTKKGSSLLSRIFLGSELHFTKMVLSSVKNMNTEAEALSNIEQEFPVTSFVYEDVDHLSIRAAGNNLEIKKGYYARCLGVYANDPIFGEILLCYSNAEPADFIPAYSQTIGTTDFELNVSFAIRDSDNVTVKINDEAWAPKKDLDTAMEARPIRYVLDHLPQTSSDYFLDLVFTDYESLIRIINSLKNPAEVELIEGESLYRVLAGNEESGIKNAKEHASDIKEPTDIAIVL